MDLFFTDFPDFDTNTARFDAFESKHILKTMRKKTGDELDFTDGKGNLYHSWIIKSHPELIVEYKQVTEMPLPKPRISLGIGFIKQTRMDFILEKGTELGISNFYIFASQNSNFYTENISRWQKITRQAIKQSLRFHLPEIKCFNNFSAIIQHTREFPYKLIAHQNATDTFIQVLSSWGKEPDDDLIVLIGPEGGFTEEEVKLAREENFTPLSFGEYRLRTETAAITAAAAINIFGN